MGTRADFYIGTGRKAEWLGSVAWDGDEWEDDLNCPLRQATTEQQFRDAVAEIAKVRTCWTSPSQGWPWPWDSSRSTDCVYAFTRGSVQVFRFRGVWPNMRSRRRLTTGERSGLMVFRAPEKEQS